MLLFLKELKNIQNPEMGDVQLKDNRFRAQIGELFKKWALPPEVMAGTGGMSAEEAGRRQAHRNDQETRLRSLANPEGSTTKAMRKDPKEMADALSLLVSEMTMPGHDDGRQAQARTLFLDLMQRLYGTDPRGMDAQKKFFLNNLGDRAGIMTAPDGNSLPDENPQKRKELLETIGDIRFARITTEEDARGALKKIDQALVQSAEVMETTTEKEGDYSAGQLQGLEMFVQLAYALEIKKQEIERKLLELQAAGKAPVHAARAAEIQERRVFTQQAAAAQAEQVREKAGMPPSPERLTKEREVYIQDVLTKGGILFNTSLPTEDSKRGYGGYQTADNGRIVSYEKSNIGNITPLGVGENSEDMLAKQNCMEIVDFQRVTKEEYRKIQGKKGFLGFGATGDRLEKVGEVPLLHSDVVKGGSAEPAVKLIYRASDSGNRTLPHEDRWHDYTDRAGQQLIMEILLPQSTAKQLQEQLAVDPGLIRHIVERVFKEQMLPDKPERWEEPSKKESSVNDTLSPPYEKWDRTSGKMYIRPLDGTKHAWNEEYVKRVKVK